MRKTITRTARILLAIGLVLIAGAAEGEPMKQSRTLTSDAELRRIHENIAKYPRAREIADGVLREADKWVARSDREIWEMIPSYEIPRAFNSSFDGCPIHGKEAFKFGNYFWKMDPFNKPWKLICPIGGEEYPSNDFLAYYKTKDPKLLTGDYPDDGWGWRKPGDKYKHWFVAYYCHWLWLNHLIPAVDNLSKAYQITGDEKYARKALVILDRTADFYPSMDHNKQSRYAAEFSPGYTGKIVNLIWETGVVMTLARSYDNVFDAVRPDASLFDGGDADSPLHGRANAALRRNIENNLVRVGAQAIFDGTVRGNYGTHQRALLTAAIVLQDKALTQKTRDYVLRSPEGNLETVGLDYALDNLVLREGIAFESSPGYCLGWSAALSGVGELLDRIGVDIFANAKFKRMYTAYSELQAMGQFTPTIGDYGSPNSRASGLPSDMARLALSKFKDPFFAKILLERGFFGEKSLAGYDDLRFATLSESDLKAAAIDAVDPSAGSHNLGGYGLGILEAGTGERRTALASYYGPTEGGHAHADKLFFELYAFGKKLIPDLGYPQFASDHRDRRAWESNTISHATVTVDAKQQSSHCTGTLNQFIDTPDVKGLDLSAPSVYPELNDYRRVMLLIGGETESPYVVDFFVVKGGKSHDYSLHGFDGEFKTEGIDLTPQAKGTLAGEEIAYSTLYDDPELESPTRTRAFGSYTGSGYSYLYNVSRGVPAGGWSASWTVKDCGVRAIFPEQSLREAVTALGNPPKRGGNPASLHYVLLRNSGDEGLSSRFACVLQPFRTGDPTLTVRRLPVPDGDLLKITGPHGVDYVYLAEDPAKPAKIGDLSITGKLAVLRMAPDGALKSVFLAGGGEIAQGALSLEADPSLSGRVTAMDFRTNAVTLDAPSASELPLVGRTILFGAANYPIRECRRENGKLAIGFGEDLPRTGKLVVDEIDPEGKFVTTPSNLCFAVSGCYRGRWLVNEDCTAWFQVSDISNGKIALRQPGDLKTAFAKKNAGGRAIAYLYDIAPGQDYTLPAATWLGRSKTGEWRLETNTPAKATVGGRAVVAR